MLLELVAAYFSILAGAILPTLVLIFLGKSWGQLPFYYLSGVRWLQEKFPPVYPPSTEALWPSIIKKKAGRGLAKIAESSLVRLDILQSARDTFTLGGDALAAGLQAIVQDDLSTAFDPAAFYRETLLRLRPLQCWNYAHKAVFYVGLAFRLLILFPIRLFFLLSSFVFVAVACVVGYFKDLNDYERCWISIVYCRLFCNGIGLIAKYRNPENRPNQPGIAISNHMTPNDIQILFAGTPHGSRHGFVVTGQKHNGIIGVIEMLVERICPSLWLERKNINERHSFLDQMMSRTKEGGPILLFPEGFCSNNSQVLQFRKAVFEPDVLIHPMAIRQDGHFGDAFWREDLFHTYLLRVMTSWAVCYDVQYLEPITREPHETNATFAQRAQSLIADAAGITQGNFDGTFWYRKSEQEKVLVENQRLFADCLLAAEESEPSSSPNCVSPSPSSEDSYCMVSVPAESSAEDSVPAEPSAEHHDHVQTTVKPIAVEAC